MFSALIIDADDSATSTIQGALTPYGFEFTVTPDASEAMTLARTAPPDIIFLRVELPTVSGFSVCNKLRRNDETKYIPLVMYASDVSDDVFNQHRNLKTHADEYLKLPVEDDTLLESVRNLIPLDDAPPKLAQPRLGATFDFDAAESMTDVAILEDGDAPDPLAMKEYDREFAEIENTQGGVRVPAAPDSASERQEYEAEALGTETDAAFDALVGGADEEEVDDVDVDVDVAAANPASAAPAPAEEDESEDQEIAAEEATVDLPRPHAPAVPAAEASESAGAQLENETGSEPESEPESESESESEAEAESNGEEGGGGFKSQREVIQLKTQLNAKKREILALKDELESHERAILDVKHKNRELQLQIGELEEKLLGAEELVITAREQADAAGRDKATVLKREEGLKARLDGQLKKSRDLEDQLTATTERASAAESAATEKLAALHAQLESSESDLGDARRSNDELLAKVGELTAELDGAANTVEQQGAALQNARDHATDLEAQISALKAEAVADAQALERAKLDARADLETKLTAAGLEAERSRTAALSAQAEEHRAELDFEETQHRAELEKARAQSDEAAAEFEAEVRKLRAGMASAEESAQADRERLRRELDSVRAEARQYAEHMTAQEESLQGELTRVSNELEETTAALGKVRDQLRERDGELRSRLDIEQRAQQALAVALRVLDGQPRA